MNRSHLSLFILIHILLGFSACSHEQRTAKSVLQSTSLEITRETVLPPENYKSNSKEYIGWELMDTDGIGELHHGLQAKKVIELLGEPKEKTKMEEWGADGQFHQTWYYKQKGIELDIMGDNLEKQVINMITITELCPLKTKRRIGIGSSYEEVKKAYKKAIAWDFSGKNSIVAGGIYGGIIFSFKKEKVIGIFIGAAFE